MLLGVYLALLLALSSGTPPAKAPRPTSAVEAAGTARLGHTPDRAQPGSQTPTYTLRGTVVNSATNEPIRNALVQLYFEVPRFALTGADGTFQFEGLAMGQGSIAAKKPGYFSPQDVRTSPHSTNQTTRSVTVGPDQSPIVLKLIPEGIISGRVSGDAGEPIESLPVHLFFQGAESGRRVRQEVLNVTTNEEGEFRAADLAPGKYFIFVGPSEAEPLPTTAHQQGSQGYPAVFYSGASDFASASPIEITPGKRAEINLSLSLQPFYRVSGTFSGYPSAEGVNLQFLNSAGQSVGASFSFDASKHTFQTEPVPPGSYTITAQVQDSKTQQMFFASRSVNLNANLSSVHLTLLPALTIPVSVRLEVTRSDASMQPGQGFRGFITGRTTFTVAGDQTPAQVVLSAKDPAVVQVQYGSQPVANAANESLVIPNVPPGTYTAAIQPLGPYYTQSARSGATDLLREELTITPGGSVQPIQIVLRDDCASLEGRVSYDAQAESAIVLIIPEDAPQRSQQVIVSQPGSSFSSPTLAPGAYKVLAVDRVDNFAYADPEVLRKYLSKASDVTLLPNQTAKIDLELVRVGE